MDELLESVAGFTHFPVKMFDGNTADVAGGPQEQALQMCIRALVLNDIVSHKTPDDPVAGSLHVLRFANENPDGEVIYEAAEIPEKGMFLFRVVAIDDVISFIDLRQQIFQLGRMGLHVVVHGDQKFAGSVIQTGHHGIVLAGILCQRNDFYKRIIPGESFELIEGGSAIRRIIIHENKLIFGDI